MMKYLKKILLFLILFFGINNNLFSQVIDENEKWVKVADSLNFPEGPAYNGTSIYFSNCYGGWIGKFNNSFTDTFISKFDDSLLIKNTNGLAFDSKGNLFVCEYGFGRILEINNTAEIKIYADCYDGNRFNRPNDLTIDKNGNLFFTDPKSYDKNILDGRIFFIDEKTKEVSLLADNLAFPNGINISPIDGKLYVCESAKQKIIRFTILDENRLSDKEDFIELPGGDPDGIEFDKNGNLYVAHYGGKAVYIFSSNGEMIQKIKTPGSKPTNLEFGDDDAKTLYLTEVETSSLYKIRTKYSGKFILSK